MLDYILANQKFRASIFDTRTHRQSTHISDHNPVVSKIRIDYKRQKIKTNNNFKHNKADTFNLDNETIEKIQNEMKHCLHKRKHSNVNEIWDGFKSTIKTTITQLLPKKATKAEKSWVTENLKTLTKKSDTHSQILQLRQRVDSIPIKLRNQYNLLKKETKKECRRALNKWWDEKTKEAEKLAEINMKLGRGGSLLKSLKSIGRSRHIQYQSLLNSDGATKILTPTQKLERWHQYFLKLINVDTKINKVLKKCNIQYDLDQLTAPLSEQQVKTAPKQLKKTVLQE